MIDESRWMWCELCSCPCIRCQVCGNLSCNGSGCRDCHEAFEEVTRLINNRTAPRREQVKTVIQKIEW